MCSNSVVTTSSQRHVTSVRPAVTVQQTLHHFTVVSLATLTALMVIWQGHGRKLPQPVFTYYACFCVEELGCARVANVTLVMEL